jgi:hypothetical protein
MAYIVRYQPVTDDYTTHTLAPPVNEDGHSTAVRIAQLDGYEYWSLPDWATLPAQSEQIDVEVILAPDDDLRARLRSASPFVRMINDRVVGRIRERYSVADELKMLRISPSPETAAYNDYVEECRAWGRAQKEDLGLD